MGRFSDAKANSDNPTVIRKALNYLAELLDRGYETKLTIAGKKIIISINPKDGISITVDGYKVFGISSDGNLFSSRISDSENPEFSASIGTEVIGGKTFRGIFGYLHDYSTSVPTYKIISTGTHDTGAETIIEFEKVIIHMERSTVVPEDRFTIRINDYPIITADNYGFTIYDFNNNPRISSGSYDCVMWSPNTTNILGVDDTGVFKDIGGVKTYL